jgi:hypothetical protein
MRQFADSLLFDNLLHTEINAEWMRQKLRFCIIESVGQRLNLWLVPGSICLFVDFNKYNVSRRHVILSKKPIQILAK